MADANIILTDRKYEPSSKCVICGEPTLSVSVKCLGCLKRAYVFEEWAFARERLRLYPGEAIEVATDRRHLPHLVLWRSPKMAWCGAEVTQLRSKRARRAPKEFPPELCQRCLKKYEELRA
jgi:hypothetical protein